MEHQATNTLSAGTAAAIGIVLGSDGSPTSEWSGNRKPDVLLAYTSTLANALMAVAFVEAVVISYWTRALHGVPVGFQSRSCPPKSLSCVADCHVNSMGR